MVHMKV
jgi:hypothetical protein